MSFRPAAEAIIQSSCGYSAHRFLDRKSALPSCRAKAGTSIPRFLGMPRFVRPNSAACPLGRYCNREMAVETLVRVSRDTSQAPFTTRDTVAVETPASEATSFIVQTRTFISAGPFSIIPSQFEGRWAISRSRCCSSLEGIRQSSLLVPKVRKMGLPSPSHRSC